MTAARDRMLELLADRALVGLGAREQIELAELLVKAQDVDVAAFDNAATAIALASVSGGLEAMPASLAAAVEERALAAMAASHRPASDYVKTRALEKLAPALVHTQVDEILEPTALEIEASRSIDYKQTYMMDGRPAAPVAPVPPVAAPARAPARTAAPAPASAPPRAPQPSYGAPPSNVVPFARQAGAAKRPSNVLAIAGWIAAAACLLLAIGAFTMKKAGPGPVATVTPPTAPPPSADGPLPVPSARESAAQLRDKLLAVAGTVRAEWAATKDPAGKSAAGEVVWNKDQQRGTMTFRGLAKNDPAQVQYQLWIFDKTRDDKYPVDGGVFDVDTASGDVVVPIRATLPVNTPTLFAITIEKPGGVVVSKREHLVLTAKLPAG